MRPRSRRAGRSSTSCSSSKRTERRITCSAASPGVNGVTRDSTATDLRPLTPAPDRLPEDIPHCYECAIESWNEGRMNNFAQNEPGDLYAYTQMQGREDLPNYWRWAEEFALSDNFFASAQGPSFPNHLFTIAAQSGGTHFNPNQDQARVTLFTQDTGLAKSWGCDSLEEAYVEVVDSEGQVEKVPPCFDFPTEADLLDGAGIPWAYYAAWNDQRGYVWSAFSAIERVRMHAEGLAGAHLPGRSTSSPTSRTDGSRPSRGSRRATS